VFADEQQTNKQKKQQAKEIHIGSAFAPRISTKHKIHPVTFCSQKEQE
jgi:hypothetical protein